MSKEGIGRGRKGGDRDTWKETHLAKEKHFRMGGRNGGHDHLVLGGPGGGGSLQRPQLRCAHSPPALICLDSSAFLGFPLSGPTDSCS